MKVYVGWGAGSMAIKIKVKSKKSPEEFDSYMEWVNQTEDVEWIKTDCEELEHVEEVEEVQS
jgi:translation elongation factor EF-1beta